MAPRILILTASVGEGHDAPARRLAEQLRAEQPGVVVETEDCLAAMGRTVSALSDSARAGSSSSASSGSGTSGSGSSPASR